MGNNDHNELGRAESGESQWRVAILTIGVVTGLVILGADIWFSITPLVPSTGWVIAIALSFFSTPLEMAGVILLTEEKYRKLVGPRELWFWGILTVVVYLYDISTNMAGLQVVGVLRTPLTVVIQGTVAILFAFVEQGIGKFIALIAGKSSLIEVLAGRGNKGGNRPEQQQQRPQQQPRGGGNGGRQQQDNRSHTPDYDRQMQARLAELQQRRQQESRGAMEEL
jgi:hypothetical protein